MTVGTTIALSSNKKQAVAQQYTFIEAARKWHN